MHVIYRPHEKVEAKIVGFDSKLKGMFVVTYIVDVIETIRVNLAGI